VGSGKVKAGKQHKAKWHKCLKIFLVGLVKSEIQQPTGSLAERLWYDKNNEPK